MDYCDKNCQKKDWINHKEECKILKDNYETFRLTSHRLFLRIYLNLERSPDKRFQLFQIPGTYPRNYRHFEDLPTSPENVKIDGKRMEDFENLILAFRQADIDIDREKMFEYFCKIVLNTFLLHGYYFDVIGVSMFVGVSWLEHSCDPNAYLIFKGSLLEIRAIKKISRYEKITINYLGEVGPFEHRRNTLKEIFYFDCECQRCTDGLMDKGMLLLNLLFLLKFVTFFFIFLLQK